MTLRRLTRRIKTPTMVSEISHVSLGPRRWMNDTPGPVYLESSVVKDETFYVYDYYVINSHNYQHSVNLVTDSGSEKIPKLLF